MTPGKMPIMIAGCGRSGTSLLRTLLDAHPDVAIPSESLFLVDYLCHGEKLPPRLARWLLHREPQLLCWMEEFPPSQSTLTAELKAIHRRYAQSQGARVWGQKTPRFVRSIDLIESNIGPCNWILIYRDPRAVVASMQESGQHSGSIDLACRRWKRDNAPILAALAGNVRVGIHLMCVKYESLIEDPQNHLDSIFDFCGLQRLPMQQLMRRARPVFFSRSRFQGNTIRDGVWPDPEKIRSWTKKLESWKIHYIQDRCHREMEILGYEPIDVVRERRPLHDPVWSLLKDSKIVYRYFRYWPEFVVHTAIRKIVLGIFRMKWLPGRAVR